MTTLKQAMHRETVLKCTPSIPLLCSGHSWGGGGRGTRSDLVKLESILAETVAQCSDGATPDCPVLDILDAGRQSDLDHISDV
jgi:hypothetical protein